MNFIADIFELGIDSEKILYVFLCGPFRFKSTIICVLRMRAAVSPDDELITVSTTVMRPRLTTVDSAVSGPCGSLVRRLRLICTE